MGQSSSASPHDHFPRICFHGTSGSGKSSLRESIAYYNKLRLSGSEELQTDPLLHHRRVLDHCLSYLMNLLSTESIREDVMQLDIESLSMEFFKGNESKQGFCFAISNPFFLRQFLKDHTTLDSMLETALFVKIIWERNIHALSQKSKLYLENENIDMYFDLLSSLMQKENFSRAYSFACQTPNSTDSTLEIVRKYDEIVEKEEERTTQNSSQKPPGPPPKKDEGFKIHECGASYFNQRLTKETNYKSNYCLVSLSDIDMKGEKTSSQSVGEENCRLDQALQLYASLCETCPSVILIFTKVDKFFEKMIKGVTSPFLVDIISQSSLKFDHGQNNLNPNRYSHCILNCILQIFEKVHNKYQTSPFQYHMVNLFDQDVSEFPNSFWEFEESGKFTQFITRSLHSHAFSSLKEGLENVSSEFSDVEFEYL